MRILQIKRNEEIGWKVSLVLLGVISLSTGLSKRPGFWTSYVLDMAGPAWNYILIRGQYSPKKNFCPSASALNLLYSLSSEFAFLLKQANISSYMMLTSIHGIILPMFQLSFLVI
jgi:hypothetical protein